MVIYEAGDTIVFNYTSPHATDPTPKVLVLHDNWQGRVHGINLLLLTRQEHNYLKAVISSSFAKKITRTDARIRQQLQRLQSTLSTLNISSPRDFYVRFVKGFVKQYDSYRQYRPEYMKNIKVVEKREDLTKTDEDKSLFDKYVDKTKNKTGPKFSF